MRYRVYDVEGKKERIISNCISDLGEVGSVRLVNIKDGFRYEPHHFRILEVLPDD